jgi:hypothetical protein
LLTVTSYWLAKQTFDDHCADMGEIAGLLAEVADGLTYHPSNVSIAGTGRERPAEAIAFSASA